MPLDWRQLAACIDFEPDLWFPHPGDTRTRERAVRICHSCPVWRACRTIADARDERYGIWGGETQKQRNTRRGVTVSNAPMVHRRRTVVDASEVS